MPSARLFTVKGRVQGVFFRDNTRRIAESLEITGYAINLPNGDVEVLACGGRAAIAELAAWLEDQRVAPGARSPNAKTLA